MLTKNHNIKRNFTKSASSYDNFTSLHRKIAGKLITDISKESKPSALLDVGCGTGYMTIEFKRIFPETRVVGLDISQGMLDVARLKEEHVEWILGDGRDLPFPDGIFNLVVSNLAYQWAGDLTQAFKEARRVLVAQGKLTGTLFGYKTCQELFLSLDEAKGKKIEFSRLPTIFQVREALEASGFKATQLVEEEMKVEFKNMNDLIGWLKSIGANNISHDGFLGPETMERAAFIYRERFPLHQGIGATFEVIHNNVEK